MQQSVQKPTATLSTETLATVMLLGLYELYGFSENRCFGWTSHVKATASIIELIPNALENSSLARCLRLGYSNDRVSYAALLKSDVNILVPRSFTPLGDEKQ